MSNGAKSRILSGALNLLKTTLTARRGTTNST
jgi:hypothetical protein